MPLAAPRARGCLQGVPAGGNCVVVFRSIIMAHMFVVITGASAHAGWVATGHVLKPKENEGFHAVLGRL